MSNKLLPQKIILVVDDDPAIRGVLSRLLSHGGYRVVHCKRAVLAPRMANRIKPSVILLDAHLGNGISGFQICSILKQAPSTRTIPVLVMSGVYLGKEFDGMARRVGAAGYIRKEQLAETILQRIEAALCDSRSPDEAPPAPDECRPPTTVLVADDDEAWLGLVGVWLEETGYRVVMTSDALGVRALTLKHRPDCIVLDYHLGQFTAPEVCLMLQQDTVTRAVPIVVLTGDDNAKRHSVEVGADQFVVKSRSADDLLLAVKASIRRRDWSAGVIIKGDVRLDPRVRSLHLSGELIGELPDNQFQLLSTLISRSPQCVSRQELFEQVLGRSDAPEESKALDKLVARLKESVGDVVAGRIHHVRNLGWLYEFPLPLAGMSTDTR